MLVPSYAELMDVLNNESDKDDKITSRYTIVIAAAKRARQLIDGDDPMVEVGVDKPISTAVAELYENRIKVVPEGEGTVIIPKRELEAIYERNREILRKQELQNASIESEASEDISEIVSEEVLDDAFDDQLEETLDDVLDSVVDDEISE